MGLCSFFVQVAINGLITPEIKKRRAIALRWVGLNSLNGERYCFFVAGFLVVRFVVAGAAFLGFSRPPIRLKASVALNGN